MSVGFGFSVGDLIAVGGLVHELVRCLDDSTGSQTQYRSVVNTLNSLQLALDAASTIIEPETDRLAIERTVKSCWSTVGRFAAKVQKYDGTLGDDTADGRLKKSLRKVQWQLSSKDVSSFHAEIVAQMIPLNSLLIRHVR